MLIATTIAILHLFGGLPARADGMTSAQLYGMADQLKQLLDSSSADGEGDNANIDDEERTIKEILANYKGAFV